MILKLFISHLKILLVLFPIVSRRQEKPNNFTICGMKFHIVPRGKIISSLADVKNGRQHENLNPKLRLLVFK